MNAAILATLSRLATAGFVGAGAGPKITSATQNSEFASASTSAPIGARVCLVARVVVVFGALVVVLGAMEGANVRFLELSHLSHVSHLSQVSLSTLAMLVTLGTFLTLVVRAEIGGFNFSATSAISGTTS